MTDKITKFDGENAFLSNFYDSPIKVNGQEYKTVEHAFQAQKTHDKDWREEIANTDTPGQAKRAGKKCPLRKDWERVKIQVMRDCVRAKFAQNEDLRQKLIATGSAHLEEGNTWNDRFWGVCKGSGANHLGRILMEVREDVQ